MTSKIFGSYELSAALFEKSSNPENQFVQPQNTATYARGHQPIFDRGSRIKGFADLF